MTIDRATRSRAAAVGTKDSQGISETVSETVSEAPRLSGAWATLVYALATLSLAWPALAGKFLVGPNSDQYVAGYAFREFAANTLRATHSFPLWNPYQFGGMPFIDALHGDIFYPTFLLRMVLPTDVAMTWGFIIHVFLAGAFTYLFLRRARFTFGGALVGGLAYMMSGHVATFVSPGHDGKLFVSALFPLLLWTILAWVRDGRLWALGAMALVVGLDVLTPHPQLLQYSLLASGAYAIVLAVGFARGADGSNRAAVLRLVGAFAAVILGLAMGAVQYLPVRQYVPWSPRASGMGTYERATSYGKNPQEILNAYLPEFTGILDHYWGPNGIHFQGDYVGAVALVLAGAGLAGLRADRRSRELWFWAATVVIALLWALGAHTPFYNLPYYLVPGTKYFRAPDSVFFVGSLGIAVFVARGVERALAGDVSRRYVIGWLVFAGAMALLAVTGMLTNFARSVAPDGRLDMVDANNGALVFGAFRSLVFVALTAALLLGGRSSWARLFRISPLAYLALLTAADLWLIDRQYWMFSPPANVLYHSSPAIDYLNRLPQPARVMPLQVLEGGSIADYRGSGLMVHRIQNVFGYHGNELARYNSLVAIPQGGGPGPDAVREVLGNPNVQRLTATQYVLSNSHRLGEMIPGVIQVAGPATEDATGESDYAFRLPTRSDYAWVAPLIVKAPDDAVLVTIKDPRFDVERAALFDTSAVDVTGAGPVQELPLPTGIRVHVDAYAPGHIAMTLDRPAPAGSALVTSENFYPGWHASVDGRPSAIGRAQYTLIGVPLAPGARTVTLDFSSAPYELGKVITWIAIALGLIALVAGAAMERRRLV